MNYGRSERNQRKTRLAGEWLLGLGMTALAILTVPVSAFASEESRPTRCSMQGTAELNRWPLRTQELAECDENERKVKATHSPILTRRQAQPPALTLWSYEFRPQESETAAASQPAAELAEPKAYVRTQPDLRMWPLWPRL
jgi:hypothetical protein